MSTPRAVRARRSRPRWRRWGTRSACARAGGRGGQRSARARRVATLCVLWDASFLNPRTNGKMSGRARFRARPRVRSSAVAPGRAGFGFSRASARLVRGSRVGARTRWATRPPGTSWRSRLLSPIRLGMRSVRAS